MFGIHTTANPSEPPHVFNLIPRSDLPDGPYNPMLDHEGGVSGTLVEVVRRFLSLPSPASSYAAVGLVIPRFT